MTVLHSCCVIDRVLPLSAGEGKLAADLKIDLNVQTPGRRLEFDGWDVLGSRETKALSKGYSGMAVAG